MEKYSLKADDIYEKNSNPLVILAGAEGVHLFAKVNLCENTITYVVKKRHTELEYKYLDTACMAFSKMINSIRKREKR